MGNDNKFYIKLKDDCDEFVNKIAGLTEDMSNRIMYSIIPSLADPAQVALTNGVVDYNALKAAIEGRKNLIEYTIRAITGELSCCKDGNYYNKVEETPSQLGKVNLAIEAFGKPELWNDSFGGVPWENIAKTTRQLIRLDIALDNAKIQPVRDHDKEVQIMRDIVVNMNVLDGLAHNSESIMKNVVQQEVIDRNTSTNLDAIKHNVDNGQKEYKRIRRLMDAKELESPTEVYRIIEPVLQDSGNINKFKDWISKMRRSEDFKKHDDNLAEKLFKIYMRKGVISNRNRINIMRTDTINNSIDSLKQSWNPSNYAKLRMKLFTFSSEVYANVVNLTELVEGFLSQYPEFEAQKHELYSIVQPYIAGANSIYEKLDGIVEYLPELVSSGGIQYTIKQLDNIKTLGNKFCFFMDTI